MKFLAPASQGRRAHEESVSAGAATLRTFLPLCPLHCALGPSSCSSLLLCPSVSATMGVPSEDFGCLSPVKGVLH